MPYLTLALTTAFATVGAILLTIMGLDYMNPDIGVGLHPGIAFPLATLLICTVGVLVVLLTSIGDAPTEEEPDLMVKHY